MKTKNEINLELIKEGNFEGLLQANKRYIEYLSNTYGQDKLQPDLYQVGCIALWTAFKRFDIERGVPFISYASWWLRKAMIDYLNENGRTIYVPSNRLTEMRNNKYPSISILSLDSHYNDGLSLGEVIPYQLDEEEDTYPELYKAVQRLKKESDKLLIKEYYGLKPWVEGKSMAQLAKIYNCSKQNIQIKIKKIEKHLKNDTRLQQDTQRG